MKIKIIVLVLFLFGLIFFSCNKEEKMVCVEETTAESPEGTGNFFDVIDEYKLTEVSVQ